MTTRGRRTPNYFCFWKIQLFLEQRLCDSIVFDSERKLKQTCKSGISWNLVPFAGDFKTNIHDPIKQIVTFLNDNGTHFTVNIYVFLSIYLDDNFPMEFSFFDGDSQPVVNGTIQYTNVF